MPELINTLKINFKDMRKDANLIIGTWNVSTTLKIRKMEQADNIFSKYEIGICLVKELILKDC